MFVAIYLPVLPPNKTESPARKGFLTEDDGWKYITTQELCRSCRIRREAALQNKTCVDIDPLWPYDEDEIEYEPDEWPACTCEWEVLPESALSDETLNEIKNV